MVAKSRTGAKFWHGQSSRTQLRQVAKKLFTARLSTRTSNNSRARLKSMLKLWMVQISISKTGTRLTQGNGAKTILTAKDRRLILGIEWWQILRPTSHLITKMMIWVQFLARSGEQLKPRTTLWKSNLEFHTQSALDTRSTQLAQSLLKVLCQAVEASQLKCKYCLETAPRWKWYSIHLLSSSRVLPFWPQF